MQYVTASIVPRHSTELYTAHDQKLCPSVSTIFALLHHQKTLGGEQSTCTIAVKMAQLCSCHNNIKGIKHHEPAPLSRMCTVLCMKWCSCFPMTRRVCVLQNSTYIRYTIYLDLLRRLADLKSGIVSANSLLSELEEPTIR